MKNIEHRLLKSNNKVFAFLFSINVLLKSLPILYFIEHTSGIFGHASIVLLNLGKVF